VKRAHVACLGAFLALVVVCRVEGSAHYRAAIAGCAFILFMLLLSNLEES